MEFCAERGKEPDRPYSGDISIRTEPELHRRITERAVAEGKTMDEWIAGILDRAAAEGGADQRVLGE